MLDLETMQFGAGPMIEDARQGAVATLDAERVLVIGGGANGGALALASTEVLSVAQEETRHRRR